MSWGKVDDRLHSHPKWRRASKGARALWTTALSWCSEQANGGEVPRDMLRMLDGTPSEAKSLVSVGLWVETSTGFAFHQWEERNPDAASAHAITEAKKTGGQLGGHTRWHVKRGIKVPGCDWCEGRATSDGS